MQQTVEQYERDVQNARSRLAQDLAVLRSPSAMASFTDSLKDKALDTKDALVEQATDAVQSKLNGFVEDVKAKAAANPAAALAIGAGIAWHLVRNPPIATALIGAGLYSLWRTSASHSGNQEAPDYLQQGKARLKEQASDFAAATMEAASDAGDVVTEKASDMVGAAKETVQEWSRNATDSVAAVGTSVKERADSAAGRARRAVHDVTGQVSSATSRVTAAAEEIGQDMLDSGRNLVASTEARDKVLIGMAGLAVAAALGMAYQKRVAEEVE